MSFVDMVFDKPTGNAVQDKPCIGKYNLSLWIPVSLLVSNILHTYQTLRNKMARLTTMHSSMVIRHRHPSHT
jgi:hypothetical protein